MHLLTSVEMKFDIEKTSLARCARSPVTNDLIHKDEN